MKKILLSCLVLLISCKKKEEPPPPAPPAPAEKQVSVKINSQLFTCDICANTYFSGGSLHGVNISETGTTNRLVFSFDTVPSAGSHTLEKFGKKSLTYEKNGWYYRGRGVLNISAISTGTNGSINQFKATFEAQTDTAGDNTHFSFTEGSINIRK
jgi:hypothetical protein